MPEIVPAIPVSSVERLVSKESCRIVFNEEAIVSNISPFKNRCWFINGGEYIGNRRIIADMDANGNFSCATIHSKNGLFSSGSEDMRMIIQGKQTALFSSSIIKLSGEKIEIGSGAAVRSVTNHVIPEKIWVGDGPDSILSIWPELQKGGISLNKGVKDIMITGLENPLRMIKFYLGTKENSSEPNYMFSFDERGIMRWPLLANLPDLTAAAHPYFNNGLMWVDVAGPVPQLNFYTQGRRYTLAFS